MPQHTEKSVVIVEQLYHYLDSESNTLMETPFIEDVYRIDIISNSSSKAWTETMYGQLYCFGASALHCHCISVPRISPQACMVSRISAQSSHHTPCWFPRSRCLSFLFHSGFAWSGGWALLPLPPAPWHIIICPSRRPRTILDGQVIWEENRQ